MAETFSKQILKVVVAQLCQAIGWHGIASSALDLMTDVLHRYIESMGRQIHAYSEQFGRTDPNLIDVSLTYLDMGINLHELEEYIKNVDSIPCVYEVPKYPIPRESHLNFLKPGSREVVTRPVHVHEHLPPMHPEMEEEDYVGKQTPLSVDTATTPGATSPLTSPKANVFKRPGDPISMENPAMKRARLLLEEEGRPLREISSVMMTTSGFLSPAREGKLPESRTPLQPSDSRSNSPQPSSYPMVPPEVKGEKKLKKIPFKKMIDGTLKKIDKENKKKELKNKDLLKTEKVASSDESKVKKLVSMKELSKLKALKSGALKMTSHTHPAVPGPSAVHKVAKATVPKISPPKSSSANSTKSFKSINHLKIPKIDKPLPSSPPPQPPKPAISPPEKVKDNVVEGKLSSEPDKQKLNIFKKISKVKDEKTEKVEKSDKSESGDLPPRDSRESSPGLVIDESELNNRQREVRMAQIDDCIDAVIQRSMAMEDEPKEVKPSVDIVEVDNPVALKVENTNEVMSNHQPDPDPDVYAFDDDLYPPGTPSTPRTPELPTSASKPDKSQEPKEKKKKRDRSKSKKETKVKSPKSTKKAKFDAKIGSPLERLERPKTPECPEPRNPIVAPPVFPFFPSFPPAPGLIPPPIPSVYPLFPRFPTGPMGKTLPHPAMPNLPLPPPMFMQPRPPTPEVIEVKDKPASTPPPVIPTPIVPPAKVEKEREKEKEKPEKIHTPSPTLKEKALEKKLHKKEKKDRDKLKKKNRKDKLKAKEKLEKKRIKIEKKVRLKEKLREKKEKKEKKKEKEKEKELREEKMDVSVPKITLRLGPASPRPPTPDALPRKIVIKPIVKKPEEVAEKSHPTPSSDRSSKREPSPELARISALIKGPPKPKSSSKTSLPKEAHRPEVALPLFSQPAVLTSSTSAVTNASSSSVPSAPPALPSASPSTTKPLLPPSSSSSSSLEKAAASKLKKALNTVAKIKPKHNPPAKKEFEAAPAAEPEAEPAEKQVAFYYDHEGNKVWICPACGGQDDGSPMIGCDDCDAWYHWVCVGIQVPPDENEDWYCRVCIVKKQENSADKKKKPRKRKMLT
ncbi:transcription initiation factor TFIID subunit 3 isoform X2 [Anabrus simplex]|uniref:transcription initiation factor TFIID subunit 3 isoform X2 n=1 Tax=Anabrus simplex TaxID=316456 RepID=UPI0035A3180D